MNQKWAELADINLLFDAFIAFENFFKTSSDVECAYLVGSITQAESWHYQNSKSFVNGFLAFAPQSIVFPEIFGTTKL